MKELSLRYAGFKPKVPRAFRKLGCLPFDLGVPTEQGYNKAKNRVLVVIGKVPTDDLSIGKLLSTDVAKTCMGNILGYAEKWASNFGPIDSSKYSFINFNNFRNYTLGDEAYNASLKVMVKRVQQYIDKMQPSTVMVFGDEAAEALCPTVKNIKRKRGWVHKGKTAKGTRFKMVSTIDFDDLCPASKDGTAGSRDQVDKSNLIGYAFRTLAAGIHGKHLLSLANIKPNAKFITTLKEFKTLCKKLMKASVVSVDSETEGLGVVKNKLLTLQFAFDTKVGYVVPIDHKDTPFSSRELKYVKSRLGEFFRRQASYSQKNPEYLIMQNGGFDVRIVRQCLGIPYIGWPLWDTIAGEFCLDENINGLEAYDTRPWALDALLASYGNDYYYTAEFSKSSRKTIKDIKLKGSVLDYCAMDVQCTYGIHKAQQVVASFMEFEGYDTYLIPYKRLVTVQMSNMIHMMSSMVVRGNDIDRKHLIHICSKQGPLNKLIEGVEKELYAMPSVKKANKILSKQSGAPTTGLFGKAQEPWVFSLSKVEHAQLLFIKILGLTAADSKKKKKTDSDRVSLDKYFQEKHKAVPEVGLLRRKNRIAILRNTFAKGIMRSMSEDEDAVLDKKLRPQYGYTNVVTGRSNSYKPSLQQIPEHSDEAKIIKRLFVAPRGKLHVKIDYSAHEVRGWGMIADDPKVAEAFQRILDLLLKFRRKQTAKNKTRFDVGGDIHKINYSLFTGIPVEKVTKEQRQSAKAIVFGSIYGMSAKSLAENLKISVEKAEELIDKFFANAKRAAKWLSYVVEFSKKKMYAYSPLGRRRNLYGVLAGSERLNAAIGRRAQNSPIQGMASDFGYNAARLVEAAIHKVFVDLGKTNGKEVMLSAGITQMVHDSIKAECNYEDFFIVMWVMEYCAVYGLRNLVEKVFKFKLNVDFAIEFEIGAHGAAMTKWDWSDKSLKDIIKSSLIEQKKELGYNVKVNQVLKMMYSEGKKHRKYLQENFPLPVAPI